MRTNKRVSAIVSRGEKILIIHRRKSGEEYWVVPGGGVEDQETLEQGLRREVKEETSLDVLDFNLIGESKDEEHSHYFYACKLSKGKPMLGGPEALKNNKDNWYHLEWVSKGRIKDLSIYPEYIKQLVDKI